MEGKKFYLVILTILLSVLTIECYSQEFPERPVPPRLVNDFTGMLSREEINSLEQKLVLFNDSTSTQIAVVIVKSLNGYEKADYAQQLAEKWGIGQKGLNNGVLILIKPKTDNERGEVFIAPGYGLEGAIPDLTAGEIVDNEILPAFRKGDYYGGLVKATSTIMALARGEYSAAQYGQKAKRGAKKNSSPFLIIFIIFIVFLLFRGGSGGSRNKKITTGGLPFWLLMGGMMGSGNSHHGSWGGSGGFGGGGGGGFGGFGGGSFGGGGAGGSW